MALIGKIRKNSWLMIIVIGLALAAFIIMDMTSSSKLGGGGGQMALGEINGKSVDWNDFQNAEQLVYGNSTDVFGRRSALWNYFVEEAIVSDQAKELGLGVSKEELMDLQFGANPSPVIAARFRNPQTGQMDVAQLNQIKQQIEGNTMTPELRRYWAHQEKEIIKDRLQGKLNAMVSKALYTPTWMVEQTFGDKNQKVKLDYVKIPFADIDDSEVSLTDADYQAYLTSNKGKFNQDEETRRVDYVVFDVLPTAGDSANIRASLSELIEEFRTTDDDAVFAEANYGSVSTQWVDAASVPEVIREKVMEIPVKSVYGPYVSGRTYQAVKVIDRKMVPDSATSRHILINATDPASFVTAQQRIDSIKTAIEGGAKFADLAAALSQDPGSADKGGKYENIPPNQFVPAYGDVASFGKIGELVSVQTQYGVHLIEPLSRTREATERVQLAYISQSIIPSEETQSRKFDEASEFLSKNRSIEALSTAAASNNTISTQTSPSFKANDYILGNLGNGADAREIIRWAFDVNTETGTVSPAVYSFQDQAEYYVNKYVIAGLKNVQPAGMPSLANIKDEIEAQVRNQKKGEVIKSKITGNNLSAIASQFSVDVEEAADVTFESQFTQGLGNEPKVIAAAFKMGVNDVSQPIVGNSGVYVVSLKDKPAAGTPFNIPQLRKEASSTTQSQISSRLMQAMTKEADVDDFRSQFY